MFEDIRPFNDAEAKPTLRQTVNDPALSRAVASWLMPSFNKRFPRITQSFIRNALKLYTWNVSSIHHFQTKMAPLLSQLMKRSVSEFTVAGLERLDKDKAYLFVSNHRDIAMDPAVVNWALYQNHVDTVRIAIGDNLLSQPFTSNLMRLNKCFIVKRGLKGMKERFKAAKELSNYIHFSILEEKANIWIAQREGRAKNGYDQTNSAVIGMFSLSRPKTREYADYINELNIVPVAISYELDPLDVAKAKELHAQETKGTYKKRKNEDMSSIARGLTGWKGRVHLEFGDVLTGEYTSDDDVAKAIDVQIHDLYRPFETHQWADDVLNNRESTQTSDSVDTLKARVENAHEEIKPFILKQYANAMQMKRGDSPF